MSIIENIRSELRRRLRKGLLEEEKIQATKTGKGVIDISIYGLTKVSFMEVNITGIAGIINGDNMRVKVRVNDRPIFDEPNINDLDFGIAFSNLERTFRNFSIEGNSMYIEYYGSVKVDLKDTTSVEIRGSD
jgi:hypothetical protein